MKGAITRGLAAILALGVLLCGIIAAVIFDLRLTNEKKAELERLVAIAADQFDPMQDHELQADLFGQQMAGIRVTIIDPNGIVTGDSAADTAAMDNHLSRDEISRARIPGTTVISIRNSDTMGLRLMYAVQKTEEGCYVRLAEEYSGLLRDLVSFLPAVLTAAAVAMLVGMLFARRFSTTIAKPIIHMNDSMIGIKDGTVRLEPESYPYPELQAMAGKINQMAEDVSRHISSIQTEKDKIDYILNRMEEGFILVDSARRVLMINHSACKWLDCSPEVRGRHMNLLTRNLAFLNRAGETLEGGSTVSLDIPLEGKVIEARFIPVEKGQGDMEGGVIILMSDVTQNRNAVRMRRDFFSNASHELKTPITSIRGSAELLCSDIPISEDQRRELLERIGQESDRMTRLINDIIMINRLESGGYQEELERLDFAPVVAECCDQITPMLEANGQILHLHLEQAELTAARKTLREIAGNLLSNAVKYNAPGGRVDVTLKRQEGELVFSVRNEGDVIPPEHLDRIFERFYRVDKGRSRSVGGTGLGLSIVKHGVERLGGTIAVKSDRESGTIFTVRIPLN